MLYKYPKKTFKTIKPRITDIKKPIAFTTGFITSKKILF